MAAPRTFRRSFWLPGLVTDWSSVPTLVGLSPAREKDAEKCLALVPLAGVWIASWGAEDVVWGSTLRQVESGHSREDNKKGPELSNDANSEPPGGRTWI